MGSRPDPRKNAGLNRSRELGDDVRNELQESVLLCELGRLNAGRSARLFQTCDDLIAQSKQVCAETRELLARVEHDRQTRRERLH
jgi:hypothetical protein